MRALVNGVFAGCLLLMLACGAEPQAGKVTMESLLGDWLNKNYVASLKKTKSPLKSWKGIYHTSLRFTKEPTGYEWVVEFNFHEGLTYNIDGLRPTSVPNTYMLVFNGDQDSMRETENDRIVYPDGSSDALSWVFTLEGKEQRIQFIRVKPSMEAYVNRVVLAGNYTDISGRSFVFTDACEAKWPDKTFTYTIGLDCVLAHCDYFSIPAEKDGNRYLEYAFERKQGKLYLYSVHFAAEAPDFLVRDKKPLHVLTPKRK